MATSPGRALVVGSPSETNLALGSALAQRGFASAIASPQEAAETEPVDLVLGRIDVLPTLDGVEPGLWVLARLEQRGGIVLNSAASLLAAHDKLATAVLLARAGVPHPRTSHLLAATLPRRLAPPYVVKPRFGSWGQDVFRCESKPELLELLGELAQRSWFRKHGALVQELLPAEGCDLRVVVAGGSVVGAVARVARSGEWRTNVALGATRLRLRRRTRPPSSHCEPSVRSDSTSPASTSCSTPRAAPWCSRSTAVSTSTRPTATTSSRPPPRRWSSATPPSAAD